MKMIKLNHIFEMVGQITYYLGRSWRKIPITMRRGIHRKQDLW